jgi:hypothetical protein
MPSTLLAHSAPPAVPLDPVRVDRTSRVRRRAWRRWRQQCKRAARLVALCQVSRLATQLGRVGQWTSPRRQRRASPRRLILLLPAAFLAHDLGEVAASNELNRALGDLAERFPAVADRLAPALAISRRQMAAAVGMLAAGLGVLAWQAARSAARSRAMTGYAAATLLFGGHIVGHVAHTVVRRRYLPGLAGGLVVGRPYFGGGPGSPAAQRPAVPRAVGRAAAAGAALGVPALLALRAVGRTVA